MNVELSLAAIDTLWEDLRLGRVPFPLEVGSHGDTLDVRRRIKAAVYADLARRGLATGERVGDGLADVLRTLAEPRAAVDLVALLDMSDTEPLRALGVVRGRHGILAVQRDLTIVLTSTRDTTLVSSLVDLLPRTRAAAGNSITQPVAALTAARPRTSRAQPGGVLRTATPRAAVDTGLRAIAAIMEQPVLRAGQLGVTVTDESGRRRRQPGPAWFDTEDGRYATTMSTGPDGDDWVTVWPADNARLVHRLAEVMAAG